MSKPTRTRRWIVLSLVTLTWLIVGVSAPLLLRYVRDGAVPEPTGLVAATRLTHRLLSSLQLDGATGLAIRDGRVGIQTDGDGLLNETERQALLKSGRADLFLSNGQLAVFEFFDRARAAATADQHAPSPPGQLTDALALRPEPIQAALREKRYRSLRLRDSDLLISLPTGRTLTVHAQDAVMRPTSDGFDIGGNVSVWGVPVALSIVVGREANSGAVSRVPVSVSLKSDMFDLAFDGDLVQEGEGVLGGDLDFSTDRFAEIMRAFGLSIGNINAPQSIGLVAKAQWQGEDIRFDEARVSIGGQAASGAVSLTSLTSSPILGGALDFDSLDISPFIVGQPKSSPSTVADAWTSLWSMLRGPGVTQVGMDLRVSAETLKYDRVSFGRSAATLYFSDGVLKAHVAEATIASGVGRAQLSVDFNALQPRFTMRGSLIKGDIGLLSRQLLGNSGLAGVGTVKLDLSAYGTRPEVFLRSLDGTVEVSMPDGAGVGFDLASLNAVEPGDGGRGFETIDAAELDRRATRLETLKLWATLSNGRLYCEKLSVDADGLHLEGEGVVNLYTMRLDGQAVVRTSKDPTERGDSVVQVSGMLSSPIVSRAAIAADFEREIDTSNAPANDVRQSSAGRQARRYRRTSAQ